jgi:hypothetical protein
MSSRISSTLSLLLCLAACSVKGSEGEGTPATGEAGEAVGLAGAPKAVSCALGGADEYKQDCEVERYERDGNRYVVLRHPDGGFRRLIESDGGKRFTAADGADTAEVTPNGAQIEVSVGEDSYLFPAPVGTHAPQS